MKRMVAFFLVPVAAFLVSCAGAGSSEVPALFCCTQETVCSAVIDREAYDFFENGYDSGMIVPGLLQNFVPQGIACWEAKSWLMISGYFMPASGASAAVLAVDMKTGLLAGEYTLVDESGREYGGHFSGVAVTETDMYVTGPNCLYRVPLQQIARAGRKGALAVLQELPVSADPGSCNYSDEILWVCEHYQSQAYPLKGEHVTVCGDGQIYYAWMIGYKMTHRGTLKPYCVFSVPDRIQGITVLADGRIFLSQSYGRNNPSSLLLCQDPRQRTPDAYVNLEGRKVPLWHLDSKNGMQSISAPPMSEGCCAVAGEVYLVYESAAYYYRAFAPKNSAADPTDKIWVFAPPAYK